jgi:hypothetical protein
MTHEELVQLLHDAGFISGWAMSNDALILWEHDQDPPAPLTRPEPKDETPSPD